MTSYGRSYNAPIFHLEKANDNQVKVLQAVFDTLRDSNIDFCVVYRNGKRQDELNIHSYGFFTLQEKENILAEIVEMYVDGNEINHITLV